MEFQSTSENTTVFKSLDWITVGLYLVLVVLGAISIYAASYNFDHASMFSFQEFSGKQFLWIGFALIIGFALLMIDRRVYAVSLQPAEFAKFATALALAKLFNTYNFALNSAKHYAIALGIIFLPIMLIILQNETGSSLVYTSLILVLYREGMSGFVLYALVCAVVYFVVALKFSAMTIMGISLGAFIVLVIIMVLIVGMLLVYCRSLVLGRNVGLAYAGCALVATGLHYVGVDINGYAFFFTVIGGSLVYLLIGMFHDDLRKVLITVIFAVASVAFLFTVNFAFNNVLEPHQRGLTGKGFLNGTQTKLKYVPEQHTDFIFCTIGEEQGFVGSVGVLLLFLALILRIIVIAERQHNAFTRVYAYCVASIFIFHLCINVGMVIGLCPVIGIPLPFFSYGGSSLWGFTVLLFILLRLDAARKEYGTW